MTVTLAIKYIDGDMEHRTYEAKSHGDARREATRICYSDADVAAVAIIIKR